MHHNFPRFCDERIRLALVQNPVSNLEMIIIVALASCIIIVALTKSASYRFVTEKYRIKRVIMNGGIACSN